VLALYGKVIEKEVFIMLKNKKKLTTTLEPQQIEMLKTISSITRISQSELFREAVSDLIKKYQGIVTPEFARKVDDYMEKRHVLLERLSR
jgi:hypothetical protein